MPHSEIEQSHSEQMNTTESAQDSVVATGLGDGNGSGTVPETDLVVEVAAVPEHAPAADQSLLTHGPADSAGEPVELLAVGKDSTADNMLHSLHTAENTADTAVDAIGLNLLQQPVLLPEPGNSNLIPAQQQ